MSPKTLDDILTPLISSLLKLNFLSLRCHFNDYGNDIPYHLINIREKKRENLVEAK